MNHQAAPRPASPLTSGAESGPDSKSGAAAATGTSVGRPSSPSTPGGPRAAMRRRATADHKETLRNARPSSTRSAGAGGSSGTMLKLYTDESPGLRVDPVVVLVLSLGFIFSVVGLHGKNSLLEMRWMFGVIGLVANCFLLSSHRQDHPASSLLKHLISFNCTVDVPSDYCVLSVYHGR